MSELRRINTGRMAGTIWPQLGICLLVALGVLCGASAVRANNIYIAQTSAGAASGADCADARPVSWFNSSGNWGGASNQIGPGTTVHLCGAFVGAAGQQLLTFQGSGASGNPITLLFEPGASLKAPYWGDAWTNPSAAIQSTGNSWIVIDGGTNGIIQNTANGGGLAYNQNTTGVEVEGGSNITIQNLTVANMCQHTSYTDETGCELSVDAAGIVVQHSSNVLVTKNTVHDALNCLYYNAYDGDSGVTFSNNTLSRCNWGIGSAQNSGTSSGFTITGNDISCVAGGACNWDDAADGWHHNGIMIYPQDGDTMNHVVIANNYIHDIGDSANPGHETGHIFLDPSGSGNLPGVQIYNNVLVTSSATGGGPANAYITIGLGVSGALVFNNTIDGGGSQGMSGQISPTFKNNVVTVVSTGMDLNAGYSGVTSDYNDWYGLAGSNSMIAQPSGYYNNVAAWTSATGLDSHAITGNPILMSSFMLGPGSAAIGKGTNLSSLGISGLSIGAPQYFGVAYACGSGCVVRPSSGAWDMGAYQTGSLGSGNGNPPSPPTNLTATVK